MDTDLFLFIRHNDKSTTDSHLNAPSQTTTKPAPSKPGATVMHPSLSNDTPAETGSDRRRRITIGGTGRPTFNREESRSRGDGNALIQGPPRPSLEIEVSSTAHPIARVDLQHVRGSAAIAKPQKRPYPPTSWKSTSSIDSVSPNASGSLMFRNQSATASGGRLASSRAVVQGGRMLETQDSLVDSKSAARNPMPELQVASKHPPRTLSRRQHTITSTKPTTLRSVVTSKGEEGLPLHASEEVARQTAALPDAETAYAHTFYYTTCPHTSPPKSRPLNVQPTLVQFQEGLLFCPPLHIQAQQNRSKTTPLTIYILEGPCSDCDLSGRRQAESGILNNYNDKLENLSLQMSLLQHDIVSEHAPSMPDKSGDEISTFTLPSSLDLAPESVQTLLEIEDQLDELIKKRDQEVRQVWKGFTARWGPGTTQIHRSNDEHVRSRAQSRSTTRTTSSTTSFRVPSEEQTPDRTSTMTSITSAGTDRGRFQSTKSRQSNSVTRTRASSAAGPRERYSDGTYDVMVVDSSVDGVESRGRMRVNWIRPERRESSGRNGLSRNSSRHGR